MSRGEESDKHATTYELMSGSVLTPRSGTTIVVESIETETRPCSVRVPLPRTRASRTVIGAKVIAVTGSPWPLPLVMSLRQTRLGLLGDRKGCRRV